MSATEVGTKGKLRFLFLPSVLFLHLACEKTTLDLLNKEKEGIFKEGTHLHHLL